jgi:hypothetical protein
MGVLVPGDGRIPVSGGPWERRQIPEVVDTSQKVPYLLVETSTNYPEEAMT